MNISKLNSHFANVFFEYLLTHWFGSQSKKLSSAVAFCEPEHAPPSARIVIRPSDFWNEPDVTPLVMELETPCGSAPFFFGAPKIAETSDTKCVLDADIVATSFYLLTRSEECLNQEIRDSHGRFPGNSSILKSVALIQHPLIEDYGRLLLALIKMTNVTSSIEASFRLVLSHDVDHPFAFDSPRKVVKATLRRIFKGQKGIWQPANSFFGFRRDPYDTFDWIHQQFLEIKQKMGCVEEIYFFMACDSGPNEGSCQIESKQVKQLVQKIAKQGAAIGLHPSYAAGGSPSRIKEEKVRLENVVGQPVTKSRHHYLRFREPEHYQYLLDAGITDDYSMGFADLPGFRNGTARPFNYFDPDKGIETKLKMHPLQIMDVSFESSNYLGLSIDDALDYARPIVRNTIIHQGELVLLFHNNRFADSSSGYQREFYIRLLDLVHQNYEELST